MQIFHSLALIHFGMSSLPNPWSNKEVLWINEQLGIQLELVTTREEAIPIDTSRLHSYQVKGA